MAPKVEAKVASLLRIQLLDGRNWYFHNFPNKNTNQVVEYQGKNWNYMPFDPPQVAQKLGEDTQSSRISIPNIGSDQYGSFPLRDYLQSGVMDGCFFVVTTLENDQLQRESSYTLAEREFKDEYNSELAGTIILSLRQPDDGYAQFLTRKIDESLVGTGITFNPT